MMDQADVRIVTINNGGALIDEKGQILTPPSDWAFLKAGDAGVTRKVTSKGNYWKVQFKKGRRVMSKGIWAPADIISEAIKEMEMTRSSRGYQNKLDSARRSREKRQAEYEQEFIREIRRYLNFAPVYKDYELRMAQLITGHAIPVGSGTVARTSMIPIEERASRAVIAWMRHQTTAYDTMDIARIKGERRKVRTMLARRSVELLESFRKGEKIGAESPLIKALDGK